MLSTTDIRAPIWCAVIRYNSRHKDPLFHMDDVIIPIYVSVCFGPDKPTGWNEFWCQERGLEILQVDMLLGQVESEIERTKHRLDSLNSKL